MFISSGVCNRVWEILYDFYGLVFSSYWVKDTYFGITCRPSEGKVNRKGRKMYRDGLDRFKKAQSLEPFSVSASSAAKNVSASKAANSLVQSFQTQNSSLNHIQHQHQVAPKPAGSEAATPVPHTTQIGGGQSTWQPPDWAIEPRPRVFFLEVIKDGEVIDQINLEKRKLIFGRQIQTCDLVLDHQSVSRQHAAVVPHRNGRFVPYYS